VECWLIRHTQPVWYRNFKWPPSAELSDRYRMLHITLANLALGSRRIGQMTKRQRQCRFSLACPTLLRNPSAVAAIENLAATHGDAVQDQLMNHDVPPLSSSCGSQALAAARWSPQLMFTRPTCIGIDSCCEQSLCLGSNSKFEVATRRWHVQCRSEHVHGHRKESKYAFERMVYTWWIPSIGASSAHISMMGVAVFLHLHREIEIFFDVDQTSGRLWPL